MMADDWYEQHKKRVAERKEKAKKLYSELSREEVMKYFKDYGCSNEFSDEKSAACNLAWELHELDMAAHPEDHKVVNTEPYRCYHKTSCKCGMASACDSSD